MSSKLLHGKLALVTGGGSGIGRAVCQIFAREEAIVIVSDINHDSAEETVQSLINNFGNNNHCVIASNIAVSSSVSELFETVVKKYKKYPEVVINCAGITGNCYRLIDEKESNFIKTIDINLKGTFLMTEAAINGMLSNKDSHGSIVNISSISARGVNYFMKWSVYSASKGGVEAFTKSVAKEVADKGIRCNVIAPGFINTPFAFPSDLDEDTIKKKMETFCNLVPMKRLAKPEEVAEVCAFLASERSSYITGTTIDVTGGL